ncbi:MAG: CPBP family intramembrane metalloprotease [Thermaerobacter sp.]|nr:CPBP family intramembrane metalloprotease [Thermaerobacter sp.]
MSSLPARAHSPRPSGWRLLLTVLVAYVAAQLAAGITLYALVGFPITASGLQASLAAMQSGRNVAVSSAIGEVAMPLVAWLFLRSRMRARDVRLSIPHWRDLGFGILLLFLTIALSAVFGALLHTGDIRSQVGVASRLHALWWEVPVIAIAAGVAEEVLFRGYLLEGLRRIWPKHTWAAVAITSIAFGFAHLSWGLSDLQFLFYVALGALFAVFVLWRRSLWPAIFAHVAWDALAFLLLYVKAGG